MMNTRWMRVAGVLVGLGVCGAAAAQEQRPDGRDRRPGMNRPEKRPDSGPQERFERREMDRRQTDRREVDRLEVDRRDDRRMGNRRPDDRQPEGRPQGRGYGRMDRRGPDDNQRNFRGPLPRREMGGPGQARRGQAFQALRQRAIHNPEFRQKVKQFLKNHPQARERIMERLRDRRQQMNRGPQGGRNIAPGARGGGREDRMPGGFGRGDSRGPRR